MLKLPFILCPLSFTLISVSAGKENMELHTAATKHITITQWHPSDSESEPGQDSPITSHYCILCCPLKSLDIESFIKFCINQYCCKPKDCWASAALSFAAPWWISWRWTVVRRGAPCYNNRLVLSRTRALICCKSLCYYFLMFERFRKCGFQTFMLLHVCEWF